ncbi:MAG: hypothetical protein LBN38_08660 [Verrucomicrobiota bacterium]|jgi:hypothetical protein|nr:hypothetical protein [Verrucomicrobiota bacterium]
MNKNQPIPWSYMQNAYLPPKPELDLSAIMQAVREEATRHPCRNIPTAPLARMPTWACAVAACLALAAAIGAVGGSVSMADTEISQAWLLSIQPVELEQGLSGLNDYI